MKKAHFVRGFSAYMRKKYRNVFLSPITLQNRVLKTSLILAKHQVKTITPATVNKIMQCYADDGTTMQLLADVQQYFEQKK